MAHAALLDEARAQLERILASPEFAVPDRLRRFLRFVVEEALAGRAERIKAYTIAVEVFGRDDTFDAHSDPAIWLNTRWLPGGTRRRRVVNRLIRSPLQWAPPRDQPCAARRGAWQ
jgi:hypothetical protein